MASRRPSPHFELYFADTNPESVTVRALADALSAIQRLGFPEEEAFVEDSEDAGLEVELERISVRVLHIKRGSAVYACIADRPETLIDNLHLASRAIAKHMLPDSPSPSVAPLRTLSRIAGALKTPIVIRRPGDRGEIIRFEPLTYKNLSQSLFVRGRKTLIGNVRRVGGATAPRCALRLDDRRRLLFCGVKGEATIQQLAQFLYKEVAVSGEATWIRDDWRVVEFDVDSVDELPGEPLSEAFDALRRAGGDAWDAIPDPARFLDEVSGN